MRRATFSEFAMKKPGLWLLSRSHERSRRSIPCISREKMRPRRLCERYSCCRQAKRAGVWQ